MPGLLLPRVRNQLLCHLESTNHDLRRDINALHPSGSRHDIKQRSRLKSRTLNESIQL